MGDGTKNMQRGFIPLLIVLIVAVALVIGGGSYIAKHNDKAEVDANANAHANVNSTTNKGADVSASAQVQSGTLRGLIASGKDVMCALDEGNTSGGVSGTMYVSGNMMRGDFVSTDSAGHAMDSHVIKNGDTMYSWTGTQGAKMSMAGTGTNSSAQAKGGVDLDQKVDYRCSPWTKDASKFAVPTNVNFVDLSAMLKTSTDGKVKVTY